MINSNEIRMEDTGSAPHLICPRCGGNNLHHEIVILYARHEDANVVIETAVSRTFVESVETDGSDNPSRRRDGLAICFSCEECGEGLQLTIAQHKGSSEIAWRFSPKSDL